MASGGLAGAQFAHSADDAPKRASLFDGRTLAGWHTKPRLSIPEALRAKNLPPDELEAAVVAWHSGKPNGAEKLDHLGKWEVIDGAIVGAHDPADSRHGAYLLTDRTFGDFELELEARPDWPVDTGIMVRAHALGSAGYQVLVDHRPKGGVGGIFGNSIGSFHAAPFHITGDSQPGFRVSGLRESPGESNFSRPQLAYAASFADFAKVWRANDWNQFRIRVVGELPTITTWINGLKICELETARLQVPGYSPDDVERLLGRRGHIGFEIHDISEKHPLGRDRWAVGAVCRWRNISLVEL